MSPVGKKAQQAQMQLGMGLALRLQIEERNGRPEGAASCSWEVGLALHCKSRREMGVRGQDMKGARLVAGRGTAPLARLAKKAETARRLERTILSEGAGAAAPPSKGEAAKREAREVVEPSDGKSLSFNAYQHAPGIIEPGYRTKAGVQ